MRKIFYSVIAYTLLACSVPTGAAPLPVEIHGLGAGYARGDIIRFSIRNRAAVTLHFHCAIEWEGKDKEWHELPYRMEDGRLAKGDQLYSLAKGEQRNLSWNPELIEPPKFPPNQPKLSSGNYRVKLNVIDDRSANTVVSAPFAIDWEKK